MKEEKARNLSESYDRCADKISEAQTSWIKIRESIDNMYYRVPVSNDRAREGRRIMVWVAIAIVVGFIIILVSTSISGKSTSVNTVDPEIAIKKLNEQSNMESRAGFEESHSLANIRANLRKDLNYVGG